QKLCRQMADFFFVQVCVLRLAGWDTVSVVGIRGKSEADGPCVTLSVLLEELRQPREAPQQQRQHSGRHRVERAQMPDRGLACQFAYPRHDIMRSNAGRLVDN